MEQDTWEFTTDQISDAFYEWSKPYRKEIRRYLTLVSKIEDRVKRMQKILHEDLNGDENGTK